MAILKILIIGFLGVVLVNQSNAASPRIIGGQDQEEQQGHFPYVVSLQQQRESDPTKSDHFCGGTIIDKQWILTSASCISDIKVNADSRLHAVAGIVDVASPDADYNKGGYQKSRVIEAYPHPFYAFGDNDLALLYLETPFAFTQWVRPATLPEKALDQSKAVTIMGWGLFNYTSEDYNALASSRYLSTLNARIQPYEACNDTLAKSDDANLNKLICVGEYTKTACRGDEGGPLESSDHVVYGVLSAIDSDCMKPAVYVNIESYVDNFIRFIMSNREAIKEKIAETQQPTYFDMTIEKAKFAVSIHSNPTGFPNVREKLCSGSFIAEQWIITSAHCLDLDRSNGNSLYVIAGLSTAYPTWHEPYLGEIAKINAVYRHPQYQRGYVDNDIALLYVDHTFDDAFPRPLFLPNNKAYEPTLNIFTTGFTVTPGTNVLDTFGSNHLVNSNVKQVNTETCTRRLPGATSNNLYCVKAEKAYPCKADIGGALYEYDTNILIGIATLTSGPCGSRPEPYVRVANHLDFIRTTMAKH